MPLARLLSTVPPSPPCAPARLPLHCASLTTAPLAYLIHRSDLLRPSPPERRAPRHCDAAVERCGARLPSPNRAAAASPPRYEAAAGSPLPTSDAGPLSPARRRVSILVSSKEMLR
jgi:hypothetical protein